VAGLGLGIVFVGYWVLYYGITQVKGDNYGFLDLGLPSRADGLAAIPSDSGAPGVTTSSAATSTVQSKEKAGVPANVVRSPAVSFRPTPGR
jgi:hypothetical protein